MHVVNLFLIFEFFFYLVVSSKLANREFWALELNYVYASFSRKKEDFL